MANRVVIGIFDDYSSASETIEALHEVGFPWSQLSLLGEDAEQMRPLASHLVSTEPDKLMVTCTLTGTLLGLLIGFITVITRAGTGSLDVAVPLIAAVAGATAGGTLGAIIGALARFDEPEYEGKIYEAQLEQGSVLVAVHTDRDNERFQAEAVMDRYGALEVDTKAA